MAITAYTGLQGSGKSYEAVSSVIVPAIRAGRRVVTNIDGINEGAILAYIERKGGDPLSCGTVHHVTNDDVSRRGFWPDDEDISKASVVRPGDLVVIDEAWRFWGTGSTIPHEAMQAFRMHRHWTHPDTGQSCDIVILVQSISDLHRSLRSVVEMTARTQKLKTLGLNKSYRLDLFEGGRTTKTAHTGNFVRRYDPEIFPLYQSYQGGSGLERAVDSRQSVLRRPSVWIVGIGAFALLGGSLYAGYSVFTGWGASAADTASDAAVSSAPVVSAPLAPVSAPDVRPSEWRVSGSVWIRGSEYIVVERDGVIRFESPGYFVNRGVLAVGSVGGDDARFFNRPLVQEDAQ